MSTFYQSKNERSNCLLWSATAWLKKNLRTLLYDILCFTLFFKHKNAQDVLIVMRNLDKFIRMFLRYLPALLDNPSRSYEQNTKQKDNGKIHHWKFSMFDVD